VCSSSGAQATGKLSFNYTTTTKQNLNFQSSIRYALCKVHVSFIESEDSINPRLRVLTGIRFVQA
jgi:hypothetical protein